MAVVVEHGHGHESRHRGAKHLPDRLGPRVAAPDDRHPQPHSMGPSLPGEEAGMETQDTHGHGDEGAAHDHDPQGDTLQSDVVPQRPQSREHHQRGQGRQQDLACLLDAGVTPDAAVETEHPVGAQVDGQGQDEEEAEVLPVDSGSAVPEVGHLGGSVRGHDDDDVEQREDDTSPDVRYAGGQSVAPEGRTTKSPGLSRVDRSRRTAIAIRSAPSAPSRSAGAARSGGPSSHVMRQP